MEESVEQFIRRNLGEEVFQRLIEPFCSGVYAGDPSKLSMKAAFGKIQILEEKGGSLVGGAIQLFQERKANPPAPRDARLPPKPKGQTVGSFRKGLKMLPEAIAAKLGDTVKCVCHCASCPREIVYCIRNVATTGTATYCKSPIYLFASSTYFNCRRRVGWKLESLERGPDGIFCLQYTTPGGPVTIKSRTVALTVPAYVAGDLLQSQLPNVSKVCACLLGNPPMCFRRARC